MLKGLPKFNPALVAAFLLLPFLGACSGDDDDDDVYNPTAESLTISSYNMGLALNFVPYAEERLAPNQELLREHDSDVICFQEIWLEHQLEAIIEAVSPNLPYIYTVPAEQVYTSEAACTTEEIEDFASCLELNCTGLSGADVIACTPVQCGAELSALPADCFNGVIATVGVPDITVDKLVERVTQPAGKFAFNGSLGLMLASRYPLKNTEFQDFIEDSTGNRRGALYAEIQLNNQNHVIGCTHPTANLNDAVDYPASDRHESWEGENRFQQEQMITFANRKAGTNPIYFAGDFNCSLANASNEVDGDFEANCQLWLSDGFTNPTSEQLRCSFCYEENLLLNPDQVPGGAERSDALLRDHVMVKNAVNVPAIQARRIFDEPVIIEALDPPVELTPENPRLLTHSSDHFGVEIELAF